MIKLVWIFVGAGVGGLLRHWLHAATHAAWGHGFPVGTLLVNVTGCLAIGFLAAAFSGPWAVREEVRLGVLVGILGGYTTFSTFGRESFELMQSGRWIACVAYVLLSNLLGLFSVAAGWALAAATLVRRA